VQFASGSGKISPIPGILKAASTGKTTASKSHSTDTQINMSHGKYGTSIGYPKSVFHRILDLKTGLDFYPGPFFFLCLITLNH
jgi:hypothetical protein